MKRFTFGLATVESELTDISISKAGKVYQSTTETQYSTSETSSYPTTGVDGKPFTNTLQYLVVGGGGGGGGSQNGNHDSGGAGAGGLKQGTFSDGTPLGAVNLLIVVGGGGIGRGDKTDGDNSSLRTIGDRIKVEVKGGGFGGAVNGQGTTYGNPGGSGGGGGSGGTPAPQWSLGGFGIPGQGNPGGRNTGGGGGAFTAGLDGNQPHPTTNGPGYGGFGIHSSISGANVGYAGGGAGRTGVTNTGGSQGGGQWPGGDANISTGGGGAAGGAGTPSNPGGNGGSGIVVIRYPDTFANATITTGSPNVIYANSNVIYRFWQSGSIGW